MCNTGIWYHEKSTKTGEQLLTALNNLLYCYSNYFDDKLYELFAERSQNKRFVELSILKLTKTHFNCKVPQHNKNNTDGLCIKTIPILLHSQVFASLSDSDNSLICARLNIRLVNRQPIMRTQLQFSNYKIILINLHLFSVQDISSMNCIS